MLQSWTSNQNSFDKGSQNFFEKSTYTRIVNGKVQVVHDSRTKKNVDDEQERVRELKRIYEDPNQQGFEFTTDLKAQELKDQFLGVAKKKAQTKIVEVLQEKIEDATDSIMSLHWNWLQPKNLENPEKSEFSFSGAAFEQEDRHGKYGYNEQNFKEKLKEMGAKYFKKIYGDLRFTIDLQNEYDTEFSKLTKDVDEKSQALANLDQYVIGTLSSLGKMRYEDLPVFGKEAKPILEKFAKVLTRRDGLTAYSDMSDNVYYVQD
jgi:hypothetical protein